MAAGEEQSTARYEEKARKRRDLSGFLEEGGWKRKKTRGKLSGEAGVRDKARLLTS